MSAILFTALFLSISSDQERGQIFIGTIKPHAVTYNASPNPNQCWEAVQDGIEIRSGTRELFFSMPSKDAERVSKIVRAGEVAIEVVLYDKPAEGSYALGFVKKITKNGEVLFERD
jgi:hypothetical protein